MIWSILLTQRSMLHNLFTKGINGKMPGGWILLFPTVRICGSDFKLYHSSMINTHSFPKWSTQNLWRTYDTSCHSARKASLANGLPTISLIKVMFSNRTRWLIKYLQSNYDCQSDSGDETWFLLLLHNFCFDWSLKQCISKKPHGFMSPLISQWS